MPGFKHPDRPERTYFAKVFYEGEAATDEIEEGHWYLFCFQDSTKWLENLDKAPLTRKSWRRLASLASVGVAHDFNNLIMGIQSNAEAMLAQPSLLLRCPRQPGQHHPRLLNGRFAGLEVCSVTPSASR